MPREKGEKKGKGAIGTTLIAVVFVVCVFGIGLAPMVGLTFQSGVTNWQVDWNNDNGIAWLVINGQQYTEASQFVSWQSFGDLYGQNSITFNTKGRYDDWISRILTGKDAGTPDMKIVVSELIRCDQTGTPVSSTWEADRYTIGDTEYVLVLYKFDIAVKATPITASIGAPLSGIPAYKANTKMDVTTGVFVDANTNTLNPETDIRFQNAKVINVEYSSESRDYPNYGEGGTPHLISTAVRAGAISAFSWDDMNKVYVVEIASSLRCGYVPHWGWLGDITSYDGYDVWVKHTVVIECLISGKVDVDPLPQPIDVIDDSIGQTKSRLEILIDGIVGFVGGFGNYLMFLFGFVVIGFVLMLIVPRIAGAFRGRKTGKRGGK